MQECATYFDAIEMAKSAEECPLVWLAVICAELYIPLLKRLLSSCAYERCPEAAEVARVLIPRSEREIAEAGVETCVNQQTAWSVRAKYALNFDSKGCSYSIE